ncbi:Synembryn-B, partial [Ophiophagus hannah]
NAINLLSNVPVSCLDVLISPSTQEEAKETDVKYNGMNMDAIQVLLKFMEKRIDKGSSYREGLTPVLSLLTRCCRSHRNIRKFIKAQVLPPLRDVSNRPEVGTTLRNKLVRLMTHVDLGVKQIAAEFLFVLCKERGHLEEPMPNPMDEMTEEQKEYEAMKLVNMFDKLSRDKVITPMGVRPDGTMTPLEEIVCQHQANEHDTSDSD